MSKNNLFFRTINLFLKIQRNLRVQLVLIFLMSLFTTSCVTEVIEKEKISLIKSHNIKSKLGNFKVEFYQVQNTYDVQITSENFIAKEGLYTFSFARAEKCPKDFADLQSIQHIAPTDAVMITNSQSQSVYRKISLDQLPDKLILTARIKNKDSLLLCSTF